MSIDPVQLVGYAGSALVVVSLPMSSVVRLRMFSLAGSLTFGTYGLLIGAPPIIITNTCIAAINIWFLRTELGGHRHLGATTVPADSPFLTDFLRYHLDDIHKFQPDFDPPGPPCDDIVALVLMRDGLPAGALIGRQRGTELQVTLDYVLKEYRDSQISEWLFGKGSGVFRRLGIEHVRSAPGADSHSSYLARAGFARDGDCYIFDLSR